MGHGPYIGERAVRELEIIFDKRERVERDIGTHSLVSKNKGGEQRGSVGSPSHDGGVIQGGPPVGRVEGLRETRSERGPKKGVSHKTLKTKRGAQRHRPLRIAGRRKTLRDDFGPLKTCVVDSDHSCEASPPRRHPGWAASELVRALQQPIVRLGGRRRGARVSGQLFHANPKIGSRE
eukprot:scaffold14859_cov135-Isochrysis_galbana.AAC.1